MRLALLSVLLVLGCTPADGWTRVELALDEEGELRFVTRRQTYKDGLGRDFLYAERRAGEWSFEWIEVGSENYEGELSYNTEPRSYPLLVDGDRSWLVLDLPRGTMVLNRTASESWEAVPFAGSLPDGVAPLIRSGRTLGGAWLGSDRELRFLSGEWLLETRGGAVAVATPTGAECTPQVDYGLGEDVEECHFLSTGDRAGEAVGFAATPSTGAVRTTSRRLSCADACAWEAAPRPGFGELPGLGNPWERFVVFRTTDGGIRLAFVDYPGARVAGGGESRRFELDTQQIGAAPRPSGGYVLATHGYDDGLRLTAIDAAGGEQRYELDRVAARTQSLRVAVVVAPATPEHGELAHVVVPTTSSTFLRATVDLASGGVESETIGW